MHVDPAQSAAEESARSHEVEDFLVVDHWRLWQRVEQLDDLRAARQIAADQFANYKRMNPHISRLEKVGEPDVMPAQVINPH